MDSTQIPKSLRFKHWTSELQHWEAIKLQHALSGTLTAEDPFCRSQVLPLN